MSPAGTPAPPRIGLPPQQFAAAFPFHIAVDTALTILQAGATLQRLCPDVRPGESLDRLFRSLRPDVPITLDGVLEHKARFFLLEHATSKLQLRGEFVELPGDARLLFLGSPWLTDSSEVAARGLGFEDFAVHDPVVDLLQIFQASKMALADAKKLAAKLAAQRTELRAANERLREQERESRRLALIAARTDNAVVLTDAAGLAVWVNEGFTRLTGYTLEEMLGRKPGAALQGPRTDPATVHRIRERLRRGEGFTEEILNYRKDGGEYWVAIEVQPIPDEQGGITHYMSIESDITARRAEQQRLAVQFEVAMVLAQAVDLPTAIDRVLRVICEHLGWQVGQLWQVAEDRLQLLHAWHAESADVRNLVAASRAMSFRHGEGYPGRVWATGLPCWIADASATPDFLRADAARRDRLRTAFSIPVPVRGQVWGVAEFFSARLEQADEALLKTFATIGVQIGEFIVRREAQEAVRRTQERFRSAFEDAHAGMALGTRDTRFEAVNRAFCEMLGYTELELLGKTSLEITHPDDLAATRQAAKGIAAGDTERVDIEKRFLRKDGKAIWVIVRARLHRGVVGNPDLLVSHFLDITARKETERELRQAGERYRLALEGAELGSWDLHLPSGVATLNDRYVQMLGYGEDELPRRRLRYVNWYAELLACAQGVSRTKFDEWAQLLHPEDAARVLHAFAAHLRGETAVFESEYRMRHKSGDWVWILDRGRVIERDGNGAPLRMCGTHLDVTFRKVAEQALRRERRLLEEARRREVQMGHEIQRSLLIGDIPVGIRGAEIAGYAEPSRGIDGDFYAFTRFRADCFELLVGDVMGKGVPAALVGAALRTTYNQVVTELVAAAGGDGGLPTPATIVNALHERLTPRLIELETFVTLALYRFDLADGLLTFVNAGHTPGLLLRGGGGVERILGENVPVGALEGERYVQASVPVATGDALLVYSDGLTEARNVGDEEFGEGRLRGFLRGLNAVEVPARIGLQALRKRVRDYVGERTMRDDETAVLIGLRGPLATLEAPDGQGVGEETFELPWEVAALERLRRRVAVAAAGLQAEARDRLVLAAYEAATNVVRHVASPFADATLTCRLRRQADRVTVELWYLGLPFEPQAERVPDFSGDSEGGFGMYIIERAVSRVTYDEPVLDVCRTRLEQIADTAAA